MSLKENLKYPAVQNKTIKTRTISLYLILIFVLYAGFENFIETHPIRQGRIPSNLIVLNEEGEIAHFRMTGGGGHIMGPSKEELRQFEAEQEAKREKK